MAMLTSLPKISSTHLARPFAVFDIDGTVFRSSLYLEMIYKLAAKKLIKLPADHSHEQALQAWRERTHDRAYEDYRQALVEIYEPQVKGLRVSDYEAAANEVIGEQVRHTYVYPRRLIETLTQQGYFLIAISGSPLQLVQEFAGHWGFDDWIGQSHDQHDGVFTGRTIYTYKEKGRFLRELVAKHQLTMARSLAVGDSMGDLDLLEMVDEAIAFNPERELAELAQQKGWKIVLERKNVIYEMEKDGARYRLATTN